MKLLMFDYYIFRKCLHCSKWPVEEGLIDRGLITCEDCMKEIVEEANRPFKETPEDRIARQILADVEEK